MIEKREGSGLYMTPNSAVIFFFSPTGTTKKICGAIIGGLGIKNKNHVNLTSLAVRNSGMDSIEEDVILVAVPVYEERVPKMVLPFLSKLKGNGKPVILVTVYGNIGGGIALNELDSLTKKAGFHVVGAGAFVGEHSFSTSEVPIAEGRPDCADLAIAEEFGRKILEKLQSNNGANVEIPQGTLPIMAKIMPKNSARLFTKTPQIDKSLCNGCGACVKLCPMGAIYKDTLEIDEKRCLRCFACVKKCSKKARKISYKKKFIVSRFLRVKSKVKGEPKVYL